MLEEKIETKEIIVSICCITYNHAKYIKQTLDGFLLQKTNFLYEIIVHDDASKDGTSEILKEYEAKYSDKLKVIYQKENQYSQKKDILKEFVFPKMRGKYVAICEGDDFWTDENKLQKQINYMEEHGNCSLTFHAVNYLCGEEIVGNDRHFDEECNVSTEQMIIGDGAYCATASLCFRSEYALEYPQYRLDSDVGDYPLQLLLATKGNVHYFPDIMGIYRTGHSGSWVSSLQNKDILISHFQNKLNWLHEFDVETKFKYKQAVLLRRVYDMFAIYEFEGSSLKEINNDLIKLKCGKERLLLSIKLLRLYCREKLPSFYYFVRRIIKGKEDGE